MTLQSPPPDESKSEPSVSAEGRDAPKGRSSDWLGRIAIGSGLLVGIVVAAFLLLRVDNPEHSIAEGPKRGVACPYLRDAIGQLQAGHEMAFVEAVRAAAHEAEMSLERSGELFGRPEELALKLRAEIARNPFAVTSRTARLTSEVQDSCPAVRPAAEKPSGA